MKKQLGLNMKYEDKLKRAKERYDYYKEHSEMTVGFPEFWPPFVPSRKYFWEESEYVPPLVKRTQEEIDGGICITSEPIIDDKELPDIPVLTTITEQIILPKETSDAA